MPGLGSVGTCRGQRGALLVRYRQSIYNPVLQAHQQLHTQT